MKRFVSPAVLLAEEAWYEAHKPEIIFSGNWTEEGHQVFMEKYIEENKHRIQNGKLTEKRSKEEILSNKTVFDFFKVNGWDDVYEATCTTIHKRGLKGKELTPRWKRAMFKSEHSPIRELTLKFRIAEVMRWVAGQLVRSKNEHYMSTGRSDRGNVPRSEQTLETLHSLMESKNAQHIIDTSKKRLCIGCVSKETRGLWEDVVIELGKTEPELAFYCVPNCIYRNGCPETWTKCIHFENFKNFVKENSKNNDEALQTLSDIDSRYYLYHEFNKYKGE